MTIDDSLTAQLRALAEGPCRSDLDDLTIFHAIGETVRETLQRVVSQDVGSLDDGGTELALVLSAKGQCRALMTVLAVGGGVQLLAPPGFGERLRGELEKFLLLSRCRLEVASEGALVVTGTGWPDVVAALGVDQSLVRSGGVATTVGGADEVMAIPATVLGLDGAIVAAGEAVRSGLRSRLDNAGTRPVSREVLELERLRAGFPAWGTEVNGDYLPHEIGLDELAVSTRKGCYIGQETMARLETYGHPNRRLVGLFEIGGPTTAPMLPAELAPEGGERARGTLTSWANHPDIGGVALAVVRRSHAEEDTVLVAGDRRFRVGSFPLW